MYMESLFRYVNGVSFSISHGLILTQVNFINGTIATDGKEIYILCMLTYVLVLCIN